MKNDSSRNTFDARKHFSGVRMQQGRVQLDADWNEQGDIVTHRVDTEASDIIGLCGGPLRSAAFHVVADAAQLTDEEKAQPENRTPPENFTPPDFLICAGRYYVDGILCENELLTSYKNQPDLPAPSLISETGLYLVYLDVWQRHMTALDDPGIREIALGGPDTATRTKTVWQVKYWFAGQNAAGNCLTRFQGYDKLIAASDGKLSARTKRETASADPCIVAPGAGYRGLENQLYRVEIHQGGAATDVTSAGTGTPATRVKNTTDQVQVNSGSWVIGQAVEIFSSATGSDPLNGTLAHITKVDVGSDSKTLTLNINVSKITLDELHLREAKATYKWSRDNGSVATAILSIKGQEITVHDLGPDAVLGFKEGQWVELIDDKIELSGQPGQLAQITKIDPAINLLTLNYVPTPLGGPPDGLVKSRHPKLRRWDGIGAVKFHPNVAEDHYLDLESGVQVRFSTGTFKTGDYWAIPARTSTADTQSGNIEWPQLSNSPVALSPFGIRHHYCRLAMLHWDGSRFDVVEDCRNLFPPVTELTSLFPVGGDGQEAMPNDPLPQLLQVGVFNGRWPVAGARVRFTAQGGGRLAANLAGLAASNTNTLVITTGQDGIAGCAWRLEPDVTKPSQQVETRLLDASQAALPPIVRFNGNLSIADQVFYDPGACAALQNQRTVQKALSRFAQLTSLYKLGGGGQQIMPNQSPFPLKVLVANGCGPVTDQSVKVTFQIVPPGGGRVSGADAVYATSVEVLADANGVAQCNWKPDPVTPFQEVEASIQDAAAHPTVPPTRVRFNVTLSVARLVGYEPGNCAELADAITVQDAIDMLCALPRGGGGGCAATVGKGGQFESLDEAIKLLLEEQTSICICLLPGDHALTDGLNIEGGENRAHINIEGCGHGSRIIIPRIQSKVYGLASFTLRDAELFAESSIDFDACDGIAFERCRLIQENQEAPFITMARARRIDFADNVIFATRSIEQSGTSPAVKFANVSPKLSELYKMRDRVEFEKQSSEVAASLSGQSATRRKSILKQLRESLSNFEGLSSHEIISYNRFMEALAAASVDTLQLRARLVDIREAALAAVPGTAIVFLDAEADTRIEDNNITGVVSLYGPPTSARLTEFEMKMISENISNGMLRFVSSLANLHVRNNVLYRMDVSEAIIALLKTINPCDITSVEGLYRRCFFTDNVFNGSDSYFVMEHLSLTSNSFDTNMGQDDKLDAGVAIAEAAIFVGNHAPNDIRLFVVAGNREKAANLLIDIVEF